MKGLQGPPATPISMLRRSKFFSQPGGHLNNGNFASWETVCTTSFTLVGDRKGNQQH